MANVFDAAEVIEMGIEKERKRRDFYGLVAASFKDKEMVGLFTRLRDWEDTHIKKFSEIRNSLVGAEMTESYQGELAAYVKATVDDLLYSQVSPKEFKKHVGTPLAAITYGMGFEKDAILFFNELIRYMSGDHKEKVDEIVEEEKKHLVYLAELKSKYE